MKNIKSAAFFELDSISNLVSGIQILRSSHDQKFEALECDVDRISLECPPRSCQTGLLVRVEGFICLAQTRTAFNAIGKIESVVPFIESTLKVVVHFHQYNHDLWNEFIDNLNLRQKNLDHLFKSLKGED